MSAEAWATIIGSLLASVVGGLIASLSAYIGVRATLRGQEKIEKARWQEELAAMRLALRTEVGLIGFQCLLEYKSWLQVMNQPVLKHPRTAILPPLAVYSS